MSDILSEKHHTMLTHVMAKTFDSTVLIPWHKIYPKFHYEFGCQNLNELVQSSRQAYIPNFYIISPWGYKNLRKNVEYRY